jgi:hypothetical protein
MANSNEVSITIHGLPVDNGNVRADVFLEKFRALVASLKMADNHLNGRAAHQLIVVKLGIGSAMATVREKVRRKRGAAVEASPYVGEVLQSIYNGDASLDRFPPDLIESLAPLAKGIDKRFSHAEVDFSRDNVIRIDDYFANQMDRAIRRIHGKDEEREIGFRGVSYGTFDGVVREMDSRGALFRGKLILTAGGKELDCIFRREDIPNLRRNFEKRARVVAVAHYDGECPLPTRLDVRNIQPIDESPDLGRWRAALSKRRAVPRPAGL